MGLLFSIVGACSSPPTPVVGSWRMLAPPNSPLQRISTSHAWTGSELFIWGGSGPMCPRAGACGDGALLDPAMGTWRTANIALAPSARDAAFTVWTDKEVFVWGGQTGSCSVAPGNSSSTGCPDGALFDPAANSWRPITAAPATLAGREFGTAVWTGKWVIVWGGLTNDSAGNLIYLGDGARYDPALDVWSPVSLPNAPTPRARHSAVWTGRLG